MQAKISCHANASAARSICDLPCADYVRVFWTVKSSFQGRTNDTAAEFQNLESIACVENGQSRCPLIAGPKLVVCRTTFAAPAYLNHHRLVVKLVQPFDRSTACPFARDSSHVTDSELAYAIVTTVSKTYSWFADTTVDWYAISGSFDDQQNTIHIEVASFVTRVVVRSNKKFS